MLLGELGGGTSVGTGISVGEGRPGETLGLADAEAAVGAGRVSEPSEGVFSWGEVGTGTSVGTGEAAFRLPSVGDVDAGTSVGTGISVGERTAAGFLFFAFPEPGVESGVSEASFWGESDGGRSVGAGISGGVTDPSFWGEVDAGRSVGTGISVGDFTADGFFLFLVFSDAGVDSGVTDSSF